MRRARRVGWHQARGWRHRNRQPAGLRTGGLRHRHERYGPPDTGDSETGDSDSAEPDSDSDDTGNTEPDTADTAADTADTAPDTGDSTHTGDTADTGSDSGDSANPGDSADTSPDTGDTAELPDTGDSTEDTDSAIDTATGDSSDTSTDSSPDTAETGTPPDTGDTAGDTSSIDTSADSDDSDGPTGAGDTGTDTVSDTGTGPTDSGADTAGPDTADDTGELLGNAMDDDGDGLVDELEEPDGGEFDDAIGAVYVIDGATWFSYGDGDTHILDGADLSELGRIEDSFGGWSIPDVDGDGWDDIVANFEISCEAWPYCEYSTGVYSWADLVATRDLEVTDYVELMGSGTDSVGRVSSLVLADGSSAISFVQADASSGENTTWIVPTTGFSDGRLGQTDAVASFPGITDDARPFDPFALADHDGDGVDDLVLGDSTGTFDIMTFSGADLDHLGITSADATWHFDPQSDGAGRNPEPLLPTDLDGDGYPDFAGVANADDTAWVYTFMGPTSGSSGWSDVHAALSFDGVGGEGDVALIGDLDADGVGDLAASSAPRDDTTPGRIVFLTAADLAAGGTGSADDLRWAWYEYGAPGDRVGYYMTAADFDQDGVSDLAASHEDCWWDDGSRALYDGTRFWYGVGGT